MTRRVARFDNLARNLVSKAGRMARAHAARRRVADRGEGPTQYSARLLWPLFFERSE
ncbi:hypothetical protein [Qipengyuania sp.]|uniref:hypothetical protein n=1 Tax=Qipengyuania sp. TaxID=2004515 RepID=UPI003736796F